MKPFISVITPTKDRPEFTKNILRNFFRQDFPIEKMELLIGDDSDKSIEKILPESKNIRYFHLEHMTLGKKRNFLCKKSRGDIIVFMDDDDYYPPDKVSHIVEKLWPSKYLVSGSSLMYVYYVYYDDIYKFGPYGMIDNHTNHTTCGTLSLKKKYFKKFQFNETAMMAEEKQFLNNWKTKVLQLDSLKSILCIAHFDNTVDKHKHINKGIKTKLKLAEIIKSESDIYFYKNLVKIQTKDIKLL